MHLPTLTEINSTREIVQSFRGINQTAEIAENEFVETVNLTTDNYPFLSPRKNRYRAYPKFENVQGVLVVEDEGVLIVDGGKVYHNQSEIKDFALDTKGHKEFVVMGANVIIMPDKVFYNLNTKETGKIDNVTDCKVDGQTKDISLSPHDQDGTEYKITYKGVSGEVKEGVYRYVYEDNRVEKWSESAKSWLSVDSYVTFESESPIGKGFKKGDSINISLPEGEYFVFTDPEFPMVNQCFKALMGNHVITECTENTITIAGVMPTVKTVTVGMVFSRTMPDVDFLIEHNNRLWGCKYGQHLNEIYASKLGDFTNWNSYEGLSTDSYVASCGSEGKFTGAVVYRGHPIFFKKNHMHKIYGDFPSNFQVTDMSCHGVDTFANKSLAIVNDILFYVSPIGVCAYNDEAVTLISQAITRGVLLGNCAGGSVKNKYYLYGIEDDNTKYGTNKLLVYDNTRNIWHKESLEKNTRVFCKARGGADLLYIDNGKLYRLGITPPLPGEYMYELVEEKTKWMAETGMIGITTPNHRYLSRLNVQLSMELGSQCSFYVQYDSIGEWKRVCNLAGTVPTSIDIPIKPKRCNHMRLRIEGEGAVQIYSIVKTIEMGSEYR